MQFWQLALAALIFAWAAQAVGTYVQMRHYRDMMGDVADRWADGFVGAGNARSTFGRGVILLLVVSRDGIVRRLAVMEGRSVLAKFKLFEAFDGQSVDRLGQAEAFAASSPRTLALGRALEQIDRARHSATARETSTGPMAAIA